MRYLPGWSSGTVKRPSASADTARDSAVASLTTRTAACGTGAFEGSVTIPRTVARCDWAEAGSVARKDNDRQQQEPERPDGNLDWAWHLDNYTVSVRQS